MFALRLSAFELALLPLALIGCGDPVERPSEVKDLRVLAVAAEPPEVLYDRAAGFGVPQVTFSALVADPRGETTTYTWRFCPVESEQACLNFPAVREAAPLPMRPMLDALFAQHQQGLAAPGEEMAGLALAPFATAWPSDLFAYHLQGSALGLGNGAWPSAVLSVGAADGAVLAQKRVTLNARDLSQYNAELSAAFGFSVCEPTAPQPGCLPLQPRTPNQNPALTAVRVARGKQAGLPFEPLPATLTVKAGDSLRIEPALSPSAFESYQRVEAALQDNRLQVEDAREQPVVSWFATAGTFDEDQTAIESTKTFDNVYTAPEAPPTATGGWVALWLVVRDLRGGTGWMQLRVLVTP